MNQPFELENLTAEIQGRVVQCCEDFEQAWQDGKTPSLEKTLCDFEPPTRELLLKELILIERYYRLRTTGKIVSEQELIEEYPEIAGELTQLFTRSHATQTRIADHSDSGLADSAGSQTSQDSGLHFEQYPAHFGRYQILSQLGEGGMGSVYLARDTQLERKVALKLPQIDRHADTQFISRFYREARAAANLNHPNLCSVYDVDEIDGAHYITMEFIEGESLAAQIQSDQKLNQREIVLLFRQLCQALDLAHQQGVVHRDLKPANIMIRKDGTPIITDFGLALMSHNEEITQITQQGQIIGSPSYMSPEQVEGDLDQIGPASDVFSLGVIMYELLSGQRPFQGSTASILSQIITADPKPIRQIQKDIDPKLDQICRKMMARSTAKRFTSFQEVDEALAKWLETQQSTTFWKRMGLGKQLVGIAVTAIMLFLGFTFLKPPPQGTPEETTSQKTTSGTQQGTFQVAINDDRASVLVDGQPLDLMSGSWSGSQKAGTHELKLKIEEQFIPLEETVPLQRDGKKYQVRASVTGIDLVNNKFEIASASEQSAKINLTWIPVESNPEKNAPKMTMAEQLKYEREVAEWIFDLGGKITCDKKSGREFRSFGSLSELPQEPIRIIDITFAKRNKASLSLPNLSRINRLLSLKLINLSGCDLTPETLKGVQFGKNFESLNIKDTPLRISQLESTRGLEYVDKLILDNEQIDDQWNFLKRMPGLKEIHVNSASQKILEELADSPFLLTTKIVLLKIAQGEQIDEAIINKLQKIRSDMTIIRHNKGSKPVYLGVPVVKLAAEKLLDAGCTITALVTGKGKEKYTRDHRLPDTFTLGNISLDLPDGMKVTPQVVSALNQLPLFHGIDAKGVKNADLLSGVHKLDYSSGLNFCDSDLTDRGFATLLSRNPDVYFNIEGTRVTREAIKAARRDYPLMSYHSDYGAYDHWKETGKLTFKMTMAEQLKYERDVAEWVFGLGGDVVLKRTEGEPVRINTLSGLPEEPFRIVEIGLRNSKKKTTLPNLDRLNRLLSLEQLEITGRTLEPDAFDKVRFGNTFKILKIRFTSLNSSDLNSTMGLQHLHRITLLESQIDDDFQFLELMPDLRELSIKLKTPELLQKLSRSPFLSQSKLRFLQLDFDDQIDEALIKQLQSTKPGMSIVAHDLIDNRRYLGIPFAKQAVDRLLDLGCSITGGQPNRKTETYTKKLRPSTTVPFNALISVRLPPGLLITPEIVTYLSQLPSFLKLEASGVKNADLLAEAAVLKKCAAIHLKDSDLTDHGFKTLARKCPTTFFQIAGTQVTKEVVKQIDDDYPCVSFQSNFHAGRDWVHKIKN